MVVLSSVTVYCFTVVKVPSTFFSLPLWNFRGMGKIVRITFVHKSLSTIVHMLSGAAIPTPEQYTCSIMTTCTMYAHSKYN